MWPETVSDTEIVRLIAALVGLVVATRGRSTAGQDIETLQQQQIEPGSPVSEWDRREDTIDLLQLFRSVQGAIILVHLGLLLNVGTNLFYPSSPLSQPNVMTSNLIQMMIPGILVAASNAITTFHKHRDRASRRSAHEESQSDG